MSNSKQSDIKEKIVAMNFPGGYLGFDKDPINGQLWVYISLWHEWLPFIRLRTTLTMPASSIAQLKKWLPAYEQ